MKEAETDSGAASDDPQEAFGLAASAGTARPTVSASEQPTEIAASIVRSSLAEIETQTVAMLSRIELSKGVGTTQKPQRTQPESLMTKEKIPFTKCNPVPPERNRQEVTDMIHRMLDMYCINDMPAQSRPILDEVSQITILQNATAAYLSTRNRSQIIAMTNRLAGETCEWLGNLFNFPISNLIVCHEDAECTLQAMRLAFLHHQGRNASELRLYVADTPAEMDNLIVVQNACRYMGWPVACIRMVPIQHAEQSAEGIAGRMDPDSLGRLVKEDVTAGWIPLLVFATIGSAMSGLSDNIAKLYEICNSRRIWLHCHGIGLAALTCNRKELDVIPNSMTLSLKTWLGLTGIPSVLIYRAFGGASSALDTATLFDTDPIMSNRISCLNIWTALQAIGTKPMQERIFAAFDSVRKLCLIIRKFKGLCLLSNSSMYYSRTLFRSRFCFSSECEQLFNMAVPVVLFQYVGWDESLVDDGLSAKVDNFAKHDANAQYYDHLNSWFGQNLMRDIPQLKLEMVMTELHGNAIRFMPFSRGYGDHLPLDQAAWVRIEALINVQVDVMRSTSRNRVRFQELVAHSSVLRLIDQGDWAGVGCVQFVPEDKKSLLNEQTKYELNKINSTLVQALQANDGAFSPGESDDGMTCVRFGMVTNEVDMKDLLDMVIQAGQKVQENSQILDTMSEILKKGIETATNDLQREAEDKIWSDGILRQVPLVGRVVNWWLPPAKETGMKGRSLNLTQGVVESTENIYKYHMQITPSSQRPGSKAPPAPLVQKSINPKLSVGQHSRNTSSSSEVSGRGGNVMLSPGTATKVREISSVSMDSIDIKTTLSFSMPNLIPIASVAPSAQPLEKQ